MRAWSRDLGDVEALRERAFEGPAEFDAARPEQPHLGFGSGVHLCAGHRAAGISIGEIAVPLLYHRLPGLRANPRRPEEWFGWVFRGPTALPVTRDPRP